MADFTPSSDTRVESFISRPPTLDANGVRVRPPQPAGVEVVSGSVGSSAIGVVVQCPVNASTQLVPAVAALRTVTVQNLGVHVVFVVPLASNERRLGYRLAPGQDVSISTRDRVIVQVFLPFFTELADDPLYAPRSETLAFGVVAVMS